MKKAAVIFVSAVMTLALGVTAFAQDYDISLGNVTINDDGSYVITGTSSEYNIVVVGANATITLDNVSITTDNGSSAIDIDDSSDVQLIVSGANNLTVTNSNTAAGIHISGGSLTISGSDVNDDILTVLNSASDGATIGSNRGEDFTGTITIDGGVTVNAGTGIGNADAAAIGSGKYGDMSGTITINDGSEVNAISQGYGAGIGSGESGYMSGDIIINGGDVFAYSSIYGAGIGAADMGDFAPSGGMTGNITINDGTVTAISVAGCGIGSGDYGEMDGTITINGGDVTARSLSRDAGIGSGSYNINGDIIINGGTVSASSGNGNIGIGTPNGSISGDIIVKNDAVIKLGYGEQIGSNRESSGTIYIYKGATIDGFTVADIDNFKKTGILNDNMNVELVDEEESGESYSLGKLSIVSKIKAASSGDKVYVYESQLTKSKLPYYVLEELAKMDDVTLVVVGENGETVEINSSNIPEKGKNAFFTVDELIDMAK